MKRNISKSFAFAVCVAAVTAPAWAIDIVTQRSTNKQHFGEIGAVSKTELTIKPKTGDPVKIPVNDIAAIKWDGEPAKLAIAKGDEDRGHYDKAIDLRARVMSSVGDVPFVLVLNKSDLDAEWEIDTADVKRIEALHWNVIRTSAKSGTGVEDAFTLLAQGMTKE